MDDKKLINRINNAVQSPETLCFDDIRARIESQTDEQREQSRRDTLGLLDEKPAAGGAKRIISFAASIAVVLGLGAALIVSGIGMVGNDSAASEAIMDDAAADQIVEESIEEITDEVIEESVEVDSENQPETDGTPADQPMDTTTTSLPEESVEESPNMDFSSNDSTVNWDLIRHTVGALGLSIDLPADAYVTGRTVSPSFELLDVYGMTAAQLEANYRDRGIYYNAMWYDDAADVTEIVISMNTDDVSSEIFDLNSASDEQLAEIEKRYSSYEVSVGAVVGARYHDVALVEHEQALFFRAEGVVRNRSGRSNHLQYMTIINGQRIEITLIEHFGIDSELTGDEPETVSAEHSQLMEQVISSVRWDKVRSGFWHHHRGTIFYGLIILAGAAAIITVLLLPENRKKPAVVSSDELPAAGASSPEDAGGESAAEVQNVNDTQETEDLSDGA